MSSLLGNQQVVFIDSRVPDLQELIGGAKPGERVFVLDGNRDGLEQIAAVLAANHLTDLAAIHIVSHGSEGSVQLGSTTLNSDNLATHASELADIGAALAPNGDFLLYGCNVASGDTGHQFVADLAQFTGADVAASDNLTGSPAQGGDWTLEVHSGAIEADGAFTAQAQADYHGVLAETFTVNQTTVHAAGGDTDGDGVIDPGETVTTTVTITNNSTNTNATGVQFNEALSGMTEVNGSVKVTPIAFDDSGLSLSGNTPITFTAAQLLANDIDPDSSTPLSNVGLTIASVSGAVNGSVVLNGDGSVTFTPNTGYEGAASFQYKVVDAQGLQSVSTGTVSLTVTDDVWYVDSAAAAGGDGSFGHAFQSLAPLTTGGAADGLDSTNDTIFVSNSGSTYTGGIVLENGQKLLGDGSTLTSVNGNTVGASANNSALSNNGSTLVTLGSGNTISGLDLGNSSTAISGTSFGTLTIDTASINTNGTALILNTGAFASGAALTSTSAAGATDLSLTSVTGSVNLGTGTLAGQFIVNGGSVSTTFAGNLSQANAASMVDVSGGHAGTLTFNTGTLDATNGTGLQFDNADGTYNFNGTTTLNGGDAGIDILNGSGGTFSFGSNTSITNPTGTAFNLSGATASNANVTYSGSISDNSGKAVVIDNHDSGTVTFQTGNITSTGTGLTVSNSNGGSVNFNNPSIQLTTGATTAVDLSTSNASGTVNFATGAGAGLDISTTSGTGFLATGGGTVTVTGTGNTIVATSGVGLNISNTQIGSANVTFEKISSGGGANDGIILDTTGTAAGNGGLHVTGTGSAGTGGTIANKTGTDGSTTSGIGIYLNSTKDVQLNWMQLNDFQNFGIRGNNVTGFTFDHSVLNGTNGNNASGGASDEAAISFDNLLGSASISNSNLANGYEYILKVLNSSGTLNRLTVDSTTFGTNNVTNGGDAFQIVASNTAAANVTVTNSTFTNAREDLFNAVATQTANMDVVFRSNNLSNNHTNKVSAASNILVFDTSTGTVSYDISHNTLTTGATGSAIAAAKGVPDSGSGGTMAGTINANTVGVAGVVGSGSQFTGIFASALGSGTHTTAITNNTIYHYNEEGIFLKANDNLTGGNSVLNATLTNNKTLEPDSLAFAGLWVVAGSGSGTENNVVNVLLGNSSNAALQNDFTNGDPANSTDVFLQESGSNSVINLSLAGSAAGTAAGVIQDDNVGTPAVVASGTINLVGTTPVTPPPVAPLLAASGGVQAPEWHVAGIGDFNGDGLADALVLRDDGLLGVGTINGDAATTLGQLGPGWHIEGVGDVNSDGTSDILLKNDDGTFQADLIQNNAVAATVDLALVDGELRVVPAADTPQAPVMYDPGPVELPSPPPAPGTVETHLTQAELDGIVAAATARWEAAGLSAAQVEALHGMTFTVADMAGLYLGSFQPGHITLDSDAAGRGWFVDPTPGDDSEFGNLFASTRMQTDPTLAPAGHYDVLTTVMHEMGHALGLDDHYQAGARDDLMFGWLYLGERRLPGTGEADGAVAGSIANEEFLASPVDIGVLPFGKSVSVIFDATINAQNNQLIVNPVNTGTVSATNAVGFSDTNSNTVTTTLDTLILQGTVWNDNGAGGGTAGNGIKDGTEPGIDGVALSLFADANNDNTADSPGSPIATTTTAGGGNYSFAGIAPGNYIVRVDQDNFDAGGNTSLVATQVSSPGNPDPDNNVDNDDNGSRAAGQPAFAPAITLAYNTEPTAGTGNDTNTTLDFGVMNAAPVLDTGKTPVLTAISEDLGAPVNGSTANSTLVSALVDLAGGGGLDNVTDTGDTVTGMAVTGVSNGTLFYTINGGTTWQTVGAVTDDNARLLADDANTRVYFQPNANFNGTAGITFRAWDQTSGSNGGLADPTPAGGSTAFSADFDTAEVTVTAVNDAPTVVNGTSVTLVAVNEDTANPAGALISTLIGGHFSDAADQVSGGTSANAFAGVAVTANAATAGQGKWQYFSGGTWNDIATAIPVTSALLIDVTASVRFLPAANFNGTPGLLTVHLVDNSAGPITTGTTADLTAIGNATRYSSGTVTIGETVSAVNDAPAFSNLGGSVAFTEGGAAVVLDGNATVTDADIDASSYNGATLTLARHNGASAQDVFAGTGTLLLAGGNAVVGGTTVGTFTNTGGTLAIAFNSSATSARVQSLLQQITYSNNSDSPSASAQIDYTFSDGNAGAQGPGGALSATGSVTVNITAANDAPDLTPNAPAAVTFIKGSSIPAALLSTGALSDPDNPANFSGGTLQVSVTANSVAGDQVVLLGSSPFTNNAGTLMDGAVSVGTVTGLNTPTVNITFNAGATLSELNKLAEAFGFQTTASSTSDRVVTFTFNDGGNTGGGGLLDATQPQQTVHVATPASEQIYFRINMSNDVQLGDINNNGTGRNSIYFGGGNTAGTPQNIGVHNGNDTSVAVDTAAGLVFSVGIGRSTDNTVPIQNSYDAFSVHNLYTGELIETIEFGPNTGDANTDDIVQSLVIDPVTRTLYVGDWGTDANKTGIAKFTYDPSTGLVTPVNTGNGTTALTITTPGNADTTQTGSYYLFTAAQTETTPGNPLTAQFTNANAMYLDRQNNKLYYVNDDTGFNSAAFPSVNGVYVVSTLGPTFAPVELTSNGAGTGQFPVATQPATSIGAHGNLLGLAVDVADNIVFFESTDTEGSSNIGLWWVSATGGANQTATKITLPAGVSLVFAGQTNEGGDAAGLNFNAATNELYLSDTNNDVTTRNLGRLYDLHWDNATKTVSLVTSYDVATLVGATPATVDSLSAISFTTLDNLPVLTVTGTATHAVEQLAAVTAGVPTITDSDGGYLASATIKITGGTFSSNENSTADDHLGFAAANVTGSTINGTSITFSYDSASETLTLTGYDTIAHYQTALAEVQYNATGDNPTNYGINATRTITWQVNDGAIGNPIGSNVATTVVNIDAVNDAPANSAPASRSVNEDTALTFTGGNTINVSDPDNTALTVTLSAAHGTVTLGSVSNLTVTGTNGGASVTIAGLTADVNAALATVSYQGNADFSSGPHDTLTISTTDGVVGSPTVSAVDITVNAVNDAPVLDLDGNNSSGAQNADYQATYTVNGAAVAIADTDTSVTDPDDTTVASATITLTNHQANDLLAVVGSLPGTVSASSYNAGTGVLTLTGTGATLADFQTALHQVAFSNSTGSPGFVDRIVTVVVDDGHASGHASNTATATIHVANPSDIVPTISDLGGDSVTFTEKGAAVLLDAGTVASVTDSDSPDFDTGNLTVAITAGGTAAQDVLGISTAGTVTLSSGTSVGSTVSVGGTAIGTIASNGDGVGGHNLIVNFNASATPATVSTLVDALTYSNSNISNPSTAARIVAVSVNDGDGGIGSANVTVNVTAINDEPTLTATGQSQIYNEGAAAADLYSTVTASTIEAGQTLTSMTLTVSNVTDGASEILRIDGSDLALTNGNSVAGTATNGLTVNVAVSGGTATVSFSGASLTTAQLQTLVDGLSYRNASDDPTDANRVVTITQLVDSGSNVNPNDNTAAPSIVATVNVDPVNDAPVLNNVAATAGYNENAAPVTLSPTTFVTDPDPFPHGAPGGNGLLLSATVKIASGFVAGDRLLVFDTSTAMSDTSGFYTGINVQWNYDASTHILTLFSADPPANSGDTFIDFAHVLDNVQFDSTSDNPTNFGASTTRTLEWQIQDAGGTANGGTDLSLVKTTTLTVTASNDAPTGITAGTLAVNEFAANGAAVGSVTAQDADNSSGFTYSLSNNAGGRFAIDNNGNVTVANGLLLDFEQNATHNIAVHVVDAGGLPIAADPVFAVTINDVNPEFVVGDGNPNTFVGGALADGLFGAGGGDNLTGGGGGDFLDGGPGVDTMNGGPGNDQFVVDNSSDTANENPNEGYDAVYASANYTLGDNVEELLLTGSALLGTGNNGSNTIQGTTGINTLTGLGSTDGYVVHNSATQVVEAPGGGTEDIVFADVDFVLPDNVEKLVLLGSGNLNGTGNNDGNWLTGNSGINTLTGLGGNDLYFVHNSASQVVEAADGGYDGVYADVDITLAANVEELVLTGAANLNATGNNDANFLQGNTGTNVLTGLGGNDFYAVHNSDSQVVEAGGGGFDTVFADVSYTLGANVEKLVLTGTADLEGTGNNDLNVIVGNAGNNLLRGLGGVDTLIGLDGNDSYFVHNSATQVVEAPNGGYDGVYSDVSFAVGPDVEELILTGSGNNNASGGSTSNVLYSNSGDNILSGNGGRDFFVFGNNFGHDLITDLHVFAGDQIGFSTSMYNDANVVLADAADDGHGNVVITHDANNVLTILGVTKLDLAYHEQFFFF